MFFWKPLLQIALTVCVSLAFALITWASPTSTTTSSTKPKARQPQAAKSHSTTTQKSTAHKTSTHSSSSARHSSGHTTKTAGKSHAQRGIDEGRTREIQTALIQQHYLTGEPTGKMDQSTKDALTKFQADNGWQTKITPDSRALIKLGLGPDHKGLLNPDTASIPSPHELGLDSQPQPGGAADQQ